MNSHRSVAAAIVTAALLVPRLGLAATTTVTESVAREAVSARNALKLAERDAGPWFAGRLADVRNIIRYGNRAGPTADQLFKQTGSWETVLNKVSRTNATYDRLAK